MDNTLLPDWLVEALNDPDALARAQLEAYELVEGMEGTDAADNLRARGII